jgi:hypothetical protein
VPFTTGRRSSKVYPPEGRLPTAAKSASGVLSTGRGHAHGRHEQQAMCSVSSCAATVDILVSLVPTSGDDVLSAFAYNSMYTPQIETA